MFVYEVRLLTMPRLSFACSVYTRRYTNILTGNPNLLEFCMLSEGEVYICHTDGSEEVFPAHTMLPMLPDLVGRSYTPAGMLNHHITAGIQVEYNWERLETSSMRPDEMDELNERINRGDTFLLPIPGTPDKNYRMLLPILKSIGELHLNTEAGSGGAAVATFLQLLSECTKQTFYQIRRERGEGLTPGTSLLVAGVVRNIAQNYRLPLTAERLAEDAGISVPYLHRIFKQEKGCGMIAYLNAHRIEIAKNLIRTTDALACEISAAVGFDDPLYFSRVFRKTCGISFSEYRKQTRENQG